MRAVLISIKPKYVEKIASGEKTIEVRKTRPKLEVPFKVYIYQTKKPVSVMISGTGKHISEYDKTYCYNEKSGKVIGEFVCDSVDIDVVSLKPNDIEPCYWKLINGSCLTKNELMNYGKYNALYGWHISQLKIYDKPKELFDFVNYGKYQVCKERNCFSDNCWICPNNAIIIRPPKSWQFIEIGE